MLGHIQQEVGSKQVVRKASLTGEREVPNGKEGSLSALEQLKKVSFESVIRKGNNRGCRLWRLHLNRNV